jgi:hypothetical protein
VHLLRWISLLILKGIFLVISVFLIAWLPLLLREEKTSAVTSCCYSFGFLSPGQLGLVGAKDCFLLFSMMHFCFLVPFISPFTSFLIPDSLFPFQNIFCPLLSWLLSFMELQGGSLQSTIFGCLSLLTLNVKSHASILHWGKKNLIQSAENRF